MKTLKLLIATSALLAALAAVPSCETPSYVTDESYDVPPWAPPYAERVRYYYLPDIEVYYDLSDGYFVYLTDGRWMFSPVLPSIYAGYDLYNGFAIALNIDVFEPWLHHQYYVSHYPRYYYRNVYRDRDFHSLRGFDENKRRPVFTRPDDRQKPPPPPPAPQPNTRPQRRPEPPKQPQPSNYYGKKIGAPVKVKPNMKEPKRLEIKRK